MKILIAHSRSSGVNAFQILNSTANLVKFKVSGLIQELQNLNIAETSYSMVPVRANSMQGALNC